jgi:hypothetical protein
LLALTAWGRHGFPSRERYAGTSPTGAALDAPLSVHPAGSGPPIDATTPLIDRPAKSLYRRDAAPVPMIQRPDPVPAEPDDDDETIS